MSARRLVMGLGLVSFLGGVGAYYTGRSLTEEYLVNQAKECVIRIDQTEDESRREMLNTQYREYQKRIESWKPSPNKIYCDIAAVSLVTLGLIALFHGCVHDSNTGAH